jgi:hypothetical protein
MGRSETKIKLSERFSSVCGHKYERSLGALGSDVSGKEFVFNAFLSFVYVRLSICLSSVGERCNSRTTSRSKV